MYILYYTAASNITIMYNTLKLLTYIKHAFSSLHIPFKHSTAGYKSFRTSFLKILGLHFYAIIGVNNKLV